MNRHTLFSLAFVGFLAIIAAFEYWGISRHISEQTASMRRLRLYVGEDASRYPDMAKTLSALGITTILPTEVSRLRAQCELRELDSAGVEHVIATGSPFCVQHIQAILKKGEQLRRTAYVPLFLFMTALLLQLSPVVAKVLSYISPFVFLMLSLAFLMPCVSCQESFALPATSGVVLIFLAVLSAVGVWRLQGSKGLWNAVLLACLLASLTAQAAFYWLDPKTCPWCIASTVLIMSIVTFIGSNRGSHHGSIVIGPKIIKAFASCTLIVTVVQAFSFSGYALIKTPAPSEDIPSPVGKQYSYFDNSASFKWTDNLNVIIVTLPGCKACEMAKSQFISEDIPFSTIKPCSILSKVRCFNTRGKPISTPYILGVDKKGVIRFAHSGWPDSAIDVSFIIQSIRNMRGGNVNENPKTLSTEYSPKHS